uniref:Uncharacterized protein n=1 Tax=Arundo donax TaxID=35708 RepID=A0A0A9AN77_ARUDO
MIKLINPPVLVSLCFRPNSTIIFSLCFVFPFCF